MPVNCISCHRFTVKDRITHERTDKGMRAQGLGRCQADSDPARYYPAEPLRDCTRYDQLDPSQIATRRAYLARLRA